MNDNILEIIEILAHNNQETPKYLTDLKKEEILIQVRVNSTLKELYEGNDLNKMLALLIMAVPVL